MTITRIHDPEDRRGIPDEVRVTIDLPISESLAQQLIEASVKGVAETARPTIAVEVDRLMVGARLDVGLSSVLFDFEKELEEPNYLSKDDALVVIATLERVAMHLKKMIAEGWYDEC